MKKAIKQLESIARELGVTPAQVEKNKRELVSLAQAERRWQEAQERRKLERPILIDVLESLGGN